MKRLIIIFCFLISAVIANAQIVGSDLTRNVNGTAGYIIKNTSSGSSASSGFYAVLGGDTVQFIIKRIDAQLKAIIESSTTLTVKADTLQFGDGTKMYTVPTGGGGGGGDSLWNEDSETTTSVNDNVRIVNLEVTGDITFTNSSSLNTDDFTTTGEWNMSTLYLPENIEFYGGARDEVKILAALTAVDVVKFSDTYTSGIDATLNLTSLADKTLDFTNGGSLENFDTITFNSTKIINPDNHPIFSSTLVPLGTIDCESVKPEWFGAAGDGITEDQDALAACFDFTRLNTSKVVEGSSEHTYWIGGDISLDVSNLIINNVTFHPDRVPNTWPATWVLTANGAAGTYYDIDSSCVFKDNYIISSALIYAFPDLKTGDVIQIKSSEHYDTEPLFSISELVEISDISKGSTYNADSNYHLNNTTIYARHTYTVKLETPTDSIPPTNSTYWTMGALVGEQYNDVINLSVFLKNSYQRYYTNYLNNRVNNYDVDSNYHIGNDSVIYDKQYYTVTLETPTKGILPTNSAYWTRMTANGNYNSLTDYGTYNTTSHTGHYDTVYYLGYYYATFSNNDPAIGTVPTNTSYWERLGSYVSKPTMVTCELNNVTIEKDTMLISYSPFDDGAFASNYGKNIIFNNLKIVNTGFYAIQLNNIYTANIDKFKIINAASNGYGYGFYVGDASRNVNVSNGEINGAKHAIDMGGAGYVGLSEDVKYYNIYATSINVPEGVALINNHAVGSVRYENITLYNGNKYTKTNGSDVETWSATTDYALYDTVVYGDYYFKASGGNPSIGTLPDDNNYWRWHPMSFATAGIRVAAGARNVEIINCNVDGFDRMVWFSVVGASDSVYYKSIKITNLKGTDCNSGVYFYSISKKITVDNLEIDGLTLNNKYDLSGYGLLNIPANTTVIKQKFNNINGINTAGIFLSHKSPPIYFSDVNFKYTTNTTAGYYQTMFLLGANADSLTVNGFNSIGNYRGMVGGTPKYVVMNDVNAEVYSYGAYMTAPALLTGVVVDTASANEYFVKTNHYLKAGDVINLSAITNITGVSAGVDYYVINVNGNTFQLAATLGGYRIALGRSGGVGTCSVQDVTGVRLFKMNGQLKFNPITSLNTVLYNRASNIENLDYDLIVKGYSNRPIVLADNLGKTLTNYYPRNTRVVGDYAMQFTVPPTNEYIARPCGTGIIDGKLEVDDITINGYYTPSGVECIINGDFTDPVTIDDPNWETSKAFVFGYSNPAYGYQESVVYNTSEGSINNYFRQGVDSMAFTPEPNTMYRLTYDAYNNTNSTRIFQLTTELAATAQTLALGGAMGVGFLTESLDFLTCANPTALVIKMVSGSGSDVVYFDNISLQELIPSGDIRILGKFGGIGGDGGVNIASDNTVTSDGSIYIDTADLHARQVFSDHYLDSIGNPAQFPISQIIDLQDSLDDIYNKTEVNDKFLTQKFFPSRFVDGNGDLEAGTLDSFLELGADTLVIEEDNDASPMDFTLDFCGIENFDGMVFFGQYDGEVDHTIVIEFYNWDAATYDIIGTIAGANPGLVWLDFPVREPLTYISTVAGDGVDGSLNLRIRHVEAGDITNHFKIDYLYISLGGAFGGSPVPHNLQTGKQGGTADEYYHLTEAEYDSLHNRRHAMTGDLDHYAGTSKLFYSDASGQIQELGLGADGLPLVSTGTTAPTFEILDAGGGGTGSAFVEFTGATTAKKTYTLPDANATLLTNNADIDLDNHNFTTNGSIGATADRILKIWTADLESTNLPTVNGGTLKSALSLAASDVGLGNVTNESKATMFTNPVFTGAPTIPTPFTLGAISVTSTGTQLNYLNGATGTTGTTTTNLVFSTSPVFTTPNIGVASGTSLDVSGVLESGANSGTNGQLKLFGSTSGDLTLKTAAVAGTATIFQFPATNGVNTYLLQTDGNGVTSWVEPPTGGSGLSAAKVAAMSYFGF